MKDIIYLLLADPASGPLCESLQQLLGGQQELGDGLLDLIHLVKFESLVLFPKKHRLENPSTLTYRRACSACSSIER